MELQSQVEALNSRGLGLAVITYDSSETLASFGRQFGITFPLLSDVGSQVITRYGILNTVAEVQDLDGVHPVVEEDFKRFVTVTSPGPRYRGIAFPGTFMLDADGRVTSRYFEDFYRERSTIASILLRLGDEGSTVPATKIATDHLELTTYPSDSKVALGNRLSLVLDVTPKPGKHVYAPGAEGYRVIGLTVTESEFVRVLPMQFPPSEIYYFEPLHERVPVYQDRFRLLQEVVPEVTPEAQEAFRGQDTLTLHGTLEYQACDDQICYNPRSVPLSWTVELRSFLRRPRNR